MTPARPFESAAGLRVPRWPYAVLLAFCLALWLPGLFTLPPTDRDESRFAQASKQMIETGDYVRIMNGAEPRNRKPIGIHWLQVPFATAAQQLGLATVNPIWPYRLPSLLGGLTAVWATFGLGQRLVGRPAGFLAAAMLAACVVLTVEAHLAKTDAALLGVTTVALGLLARAYLAPAEFSWRHAAAFWLAMGAGILLKGPITPMVAALACATLAVWDRRAKWLVDVLCPAWGVPLAVLVVLPWFVAIGIATHGAFFQDAIGGDLGRKLTSGDDAHGGFPGEHFLLLPLLAFPSSLLVLGALPGLWQLRDDATRFLVAWIVPAWLVFEAVPTKLPHYTLPLYPALFLLAARWTLDGGTLDSVRRGLSRWWRTILLVLSALAVATLAVGAVALPWIVHRPPWLGVPSLAAIVLVAWLAMRQRSAMLVLVTMPLVTITLIGVELPHLSPLWIAPRVEQVLLRSGVTGRLGAAGFHEPSLLFLSGTSTDWLPTGAAAAAALDTGEVAAVLIGDRDEVSFEAEATRRAMAVVPIGHIDGFNYSRGRSVVLTVYRR